MHTKLHHQVCTMDQSPQCQVRWGNSDNLNIGHSISYRYMFFTFIPCIHLFVFIIFTSASAQLTLCLMHSRNVARNLCLSQSEAGTSSRAVLSNLVLIVLCVLVLLSSIQYYLFLDSSIQSCRVLYSPVYSCLVLLSPVQWWKALFSLIQS